MIDYVKGEVADLTPATVTIDCNGVGYLAHISLQTYSAIGDKKLQRYIYTNRCAKMLCAIGFIDKHEREVFMHPHQRVGCGPALHELCLFA